ncbi:ROK family transcriptional regulator [Effusibacillus consociatus]|uniref:ROK family transcriptional regulator n=1 Tax=Effusibacillus consociatus TaxID=1117041 RepID=A0ABV9PYV9_9BACL
MHDRRPPGNVQLMKQMNRAAILQLLRDQGQLSRAALAELTALSKPSISALVDELIQEGWIREVGIGESSGGRRPILLEINAEGFAIVGAVFEGTGLELAVSDLNGELLAEKHVVIKGDATGGQILDEFEGKIRSFLHEARVNYDRVLGIGVGLPGVTRRGSGIISFSPSTGWNDWPVLDELEKRFSLPVFLDNDVNLMALGEFYKGAGYGVQNLVYMHVGTGIGAGIILNGQLFRGFSEAAGEIGYMVVGNPDKRNHREYGVFEGNYSALALLERAASDPNLKLLLDENSTSAGVIKKLTELSDVSPEANGLLQEVCLHWSYGIANIVCVLNPELVILGGDMVHIGDCGLKLIQDSLSRLVPIVPELKFAELGDRGGVVGAVFHVLEADRSLSGKLGGTTVS